MGAKGENFVQTFQTPFGVLQFHLAVPGMASFEEAESTAVQLSLEDGTSCRVLSVQSLLQTKQAAADPRPDGHRIPERETAQRESIAHSRFTTKTTLVRLWREKNERTAEELGGLLPAAKQPATHARVAYKTGSVCCWPGLYPRRLASTARHP